MMRLLLGCPEPSLLVEVRGTFKPEQFSFTVVNGAWDGHFLRGWVYVDDTANDMNPLVGEFMVISDCQESLAGDYNDVFNNFKEAPFSCMYKR